MYAYKKAGAKLNPEWSRSAVFLFVYFYAFKTHWAGIKDIRELNNA